MTWASDNSVVRSGVSAVIVPAVARAESEIADKARQKKDAAQECADHFRAPREVRGRGETNVR